MSLRHLKPILHESCKQGSRAKKSHRCQEHTDTLSCKSASLSPDRKGPLRFLTGVETSSQISHQCEILAINTEIGRVNAPTRRSQGYSLAMLPLRMREAHWVQQSCLHPGTVTAWSQEVKTTRRYAMHLHAYIYGMSQFSLRLCFRNVLS